MATFTEINKLSLLQANYVYKENQHQFQEPYIPYMPIDDEEEETVFSLFGGIIRDLLGWSLLINIGYLKLSSFFSLVADQFKFFKYLGYFCNKYVQELIRKVYMGLEWVGGRDILSFSMSGTVELISLTSFMRHLGFFSIFFCVCDTLFSFFLIQLLN
jgi:hypothetical protein